MQFDTSHVSLERLTIKLETSLTESLTVIMVTKELRLLERGSASQKINIARDDARHRHKKSATVKAARDRL